MYNAISLTNKNETKCGLQNKTMLKCLFIFVDQNETKRNVITLFRLVLSRFLCLTHGLTSGADIRVARFRNKTHPIATQLGKTTHGNSVKVAQYRGKTADMATLCADAGDVTSSSSTLGII